MRLILSLIIWKQLTYWRPLYKEESESKSEVKKNLISINKVFGNALENKTPMQLVGGVL